MNRFAFSDGDRRIHESVKECDSNSCVGLAATVLAVAESFVIECERGGDGERWTVREERGVEREDEENETE